ANGLPNGFSIGSSSGVISGTASSGSTSPGKFSVNVTAKDSLNVSYSKTMSIGLLAPAATLPAIAPSGSGSSIKDCTLGQPCNRTIAVQNGGAAPFTWIA